MPTAKYLYLLGVCVGLLAPATPLRAVIITATPPAATISYKKGAGTTTTAKVAIAPSSGAIYFTVDPATLPPWLQVDKTNGSPSTAAPVSLTFSPSPLVATIAAGTYSASVGILSGSLTPIAIPVTLSVIAVPPNVSATLSSIPVWTPGNVLPTATLSVKSTSDPVSYSVTATPSWIVPQASSGVAYSWGSTIPVLFAQSGFDNASAGTPLTGSITVKGANNTVTVNVSIAIGNPVATISSIYPAKLPQTISPGSTRTISVTGVNFFSGMPVTLDWRALTNNCSTFAAAAGEALCIQSSQQFFVKLTDTDLANAAQNGNAIHLRIGNAIWPIPVTTGPIVNAVTDSAALVQYSPPSYLTVAPYEIISIFGDNFSTSPVVYGSLDGAGRYSPYVTDNGQFISVQFMDASNTPLAQDTNGYILLATPNQINVLVPSSLPAPAGGRELKLVVETSQRSDDVILNVGAANPGVFTFGGGTGQAVVVNGDGTINSSANPAKLTSPATSITLYLSGMGVPQGGSAVAGVDPGLPGSIPAGCATPVSFLNAANLRYFQAPPNPVVWNTFDGAVIASAVLGPNIYPPCFDPAGVTVKIGKATATGTVTYTGWLADSIAGLYQVNVTLPTSNAGMTPTVTGGTAYPLVVNIGGVDSQTNVFVYLK